MEHKALTFYEVIEIRKANPDKFDRNQCVSCGSQGPHELKDYDMMWHDGDIFCKTCGSYVRMYDAG